MIVNESLFMVFEKLLWNIHHLYKEINNNKRNRIEEKEEEGEEEELLVKVPRIQWKCMYYACTTRERVTKSHKLTALPAGLRALHSFCRIGFVHSRAHDVYDTIHMSSCYGDRQESQLSHRNRMTLGIIWNFYIDKSKSSDNDSLKFSSQSALISKQNGAFCVVNNFEY